ncbi:proliferating cell nuclear antigen, N-terminal domain-containing protein [Gymnopilus junonius]|uniref:DNA sliding clamp PCNA n=1 Tax=Gymnopilus junonius TaxID=109634 RepID=A0A9P5N9R5_GYMJU|nr:proliferating cell nuclear antigen, N-terminal domain-containing protein [Gymnopilus junonius]
MLEAKLQEAGTLKKLLDSIKELVTDANFECNEEAIVLQAMDNSHVALVSVKFSAAAFKRYRCDRPMPLGVNLTSLNKVLRCAKDDDICTLKAADEADVLNLVYEAKNSDRIAKYDMKLMDIDADTLQIPDTEYDARVTLPSSEFTRIVRDLSQLGESVRIEVSKEGVRFASDGEAANGSVLLRQSDGALISGTTIRPKSDGKEGGEDGGDEAEGSSSAKKEKAKVKKEKGDEDVDMSHEKDDNEDEEEEEFKPVENDEEGEEEQENEEDEEEEDGGSKKRKKKANGTSKPAKKPKTAKSKGKATEEDESATDVIIEMNQHVCLTFSLKYLVNFSKSATLSNKVQLMMSNDVPLLVSYDFNQGYIRYYLAPKIGED